MIKRNNGLSWSQWCTTWSLVLILLSNSIQVDASKTKNNRPRPSSNNGRGSNPSLSGLSYSPGDIPSRSHVPQQQSRPVQAGPPPAPAPAAVAPPYPVQQSHPVQSGPPSAPLPYPAVPHQPSAPEPPKGNIGWNVGEQRVSVNSVNSAPNQPQAHPVPQPYPGTVTIYAHYHLNVQMIFSNKILAECIAV